MTGKAMTSLRNAAAAAPSLSEGLYRTVSSRTGTHNNSGTNELMHVDTPPSTSPRDIEADPKKSYFPEPYERPLPVPLQAHEGTILEMIIIRRIVISKMLEVSTQF
jgi:hypothetical protein